MDQPDHKTDLSRKVAGFAVWRWTPWKRSVLIVAAVFGYPLSLGPACWFASHGYVPEKAVLFAYFPLLLLCDWNDTLSIALATYIELWVPPVDQMQ